MDIQTSKIELTKAILEIQSQKLIEDIFSLIQSKSNLTQEQELAIDEAIYSLDKNDGIPHHIVMEETRNRYSKYFR